MRLMAPKIGTLEASGIRPMLHQSRMDDGEVIKEFHAQINYHEYAKWYNLNYMDKAVSYFIFVLCRHHIFYSTPCILRAALTF